VGCWWHQQDPIISRGSPIVLEEGMVIAMEPQLDYWHIQDMSIVTNGALTSLPPQLLVTKDPTGKNAAS